MKTNYHTHTSRCHHALGTDEAYVQAAINNGYSLLGFSDHTPWPYRQRDFVSRIRMSMEEYPGYLASIRRLQKKFCDQIEILVGVEAEYFPEYLGWLEQQLSRGNLDYAIFGNHYRQSDEVRQNNPYFGNCRHREEDLQAYLDCMLKGMESGLFSIIAHPDLFCRSDPSFDEPCRSVSRMICERAKDLNCVLELNVSGYAYARKMGQAGTPHPEFWKIAAEVGNTVILGLDAHHPGALQEDQDREAGLQLAKRLKLKLIDQIPLLR